MPEYKDNKAALPPGRSRGEILHPRLGAPPGQAPRNPAGSSFAARFGRAILKHGIAAIPSALFHFQGKLGLSAQQVWFVSYILSHKWDEELPYPSIAQMSRCTGVSDRMLRYRCNELHHLGYLQMYPRFLESGGQGSNYYDFGSIFARLEEIIAQEPPRPNAIRDGDGDGDGERPAMQVVPGQGDSSFLARYGRVILGYGIASVPRALFTHQKALDLSAQQIWFTCYILSFQWESALPYPSINKMAERTGYSKQQIHAVKGELVAKGYLRIERRLAEGGGNDTNLYDFSPLFDAIRSQLEPVPHDAENRQGGSAGSDESTEAAELSESGLGDSSPAAPMPRRHRPSQPKYARTAFIPAPASVLESKVSTDEIDGAAMGLTRGTAIRFTTRPATELSTRPATGLTGEAETELPRGVKPASTRPLKQALPERRKHSLPKVETSKEETLDKDDSNHLHPENKSDNGVTRPESAREYGKSRAEYSPYISRVITDFSEELGDGEHTVSNVSQALRLWTASNMDEKEFVEVLYTAKRRTRVGQGMHGSAGLRNRMAYFYTVLRQLLDGSLD